MNVRIYVTCHKPGRRIGNRVIVPIHGGKGCSSADLGIPGDDSGDHISHLNPYYCELTTQYWVWKNCPGLDYVGFMHYRRHFLFGDPCRAVDEVSGCVNIWRWDEDYERLIGLSDPAIIEETVQGYDLVVPPPFPIRNWGSTTVADQLGTILQLNRRLQFNRANVDLALEVIESREPAYTSALREVFFEAYGSYYFFNSYIMRWTLFDEYCRWLFPLLDAIHQRLDYSRLSPTERRLLGFLSERLFNVYLRHYQANARPLAIRHIPLTQFDEAIATLCCQGKLLAAASRFAEKLKVMLAETRQRGPRYVLRRVLHLSTKV